LDNKKKEWGEANKFVSFSLIRKYFCNLLFFFFQHFRPILADQEGSPENGEQITHLRKTLCDVVLVSGVYSIALHPLPCYFFFHFLFYFFDRSHFFFDMLKHTATASTKLVLRSTCKRQLSTAPVVLAGRQGGMRRKAEKKFDVDFMPRFDFDDQTTIGHTLFDNIRQVREYLRNTDFELPNLNFKQKKKKKKREGQDTMIQNTNPLVDSFVIAYVKPFEAPSADMILKFKSHTYLGEGHPVERKVVLSVKVEDLKLTDSEKHKFLLLSGSRYNVNTEELVMSSERFPHRRQNKKFLVDTLNKLIAESKVRDRMDHLGEGDIKTYTCFFLM
jgi:hypothetical protein